VDGSGRISLANLGQPPFKPPERLLQRRTAPRGPAIKPQTRLPPNDFTTLIVKGRGPRRGGLKTGVTLVSPTADPQSLAAVTLKKRRQLATSELRHGHQCAIRTTHPTVSLQTQLPQAGWKLGTVWRWCHGSCSMGLGRMLQ
jgi:hypothetical protein